MWAPTGESGAIVASTEITDYYEYLIEPMRYKDELLNA
jgi:hypothetical protein